MMFPRDTNDKFIAFLNSKGFMPILLPYAGILPPTVYHLEGERFIRYAALTDLVKGRPDLARTLETAPQDAVDLEKTLAAKKGGKISFRLLDGILQFFGAAVAPKIEAAADAGDDVNFSYKKCLTCEVLPDAIEKVLKEIPPEKFGEALANKKVHIACQYLYAREVDVSAGKAVNGSFDLGVEMAKVGGVGAAGHKENKAQEAIFWKGTTPLAFAFRVAGLTYENGKYRLNWEAPKGPACCRGREAASPICRRPDRSTKSSIIRDAWPPRSGQSGCPSRIEAGNFDSSVIV